jgi:hypothetical protein
MTRKVLSPPPPKSHRGRLALYSDVFCGVPLLEVPEELGAALGAETRLQVSGLGRGPPSAACQLPALSPALMGFQSFAPCLDRLDEPGSLIHVSAALWIATILSSPGNYAGPPLSVPYLLSLPCLPSTSWDPHSIPA